MNFPNILHPLISNIISFLSENMFCIISILLHVWGLVYGLTYDLFWIMFHIHLRKMCIFVWENVLKMPVRSNWFIVLFKYSVSLLIFYLLILSINESAVLKSPTISIKLFISPFIYPYFCSRYFGILLVVSYIFTNVMSSGWVNTFIIIKFPSLCVVKFLF